jgi:phage baseplate assembly protein V
MIERMLAPIRRRIGQMVLKAVVETVDDSDQMQILSATVGSDESLAGIQRVQPHGLTSNPVEGSEAVVLLVNGNRDMPVAVVIGTSAARPTGLKAGEVAVYRDQNNMVLFKENGDIEVTSEGTFSVNGANLTVDP